MASWWEGTSKQYHTYLKRWRQYCDEKDIDLFQPGVHQKNINGVEYTRQVLATVLWTQPVLPFLPFLF